VEGDDGGAKLGVGAIGGATDAITGDRRRSGGEGWWTGGRCRRGRAAGGGWGAADGSDSNSDSESARRDVWCLMAGVTFSATT
jgi:hypothetical protein